MCGVVYGTELSSTQPVTQQELREAGTPERRAWKGQSASELVADPQPVPFGIFFRMGQSRSSAYKQGYKK